MQVPTLHVGMRPYDGREYSNIEYEEVPDNWLCYLTNQYVPATGKQQGLWFLTRIGWNANYENIKQAFEAAEHRTRTWEEYEQYAERFFREVETKTQRKINDLEERVEQLYNGLICYR